MYTHKQIILFLLFTGSFSLTQAGNKFHICPKEGTSTDCHPDDQCAIAISSDEQKNYYKLSAINKILINQPSSIDPEGSDRILFGLAASETEVPSVLKNDKVFVYPNPVEEELYIKGGNNENVELFSIDGTIKKKVQTVSNGVTMINVSDQKSGIYFVRIGEDVIKITKK